MFMETPIRVHAFIAITDINICAVCSSLKSELVLCTNLRQTIHELNSTPLFLKNSLLFCRMHFCEKRTS
jgi:hypothetical protein